MKELDIVVLKHDIEGNDLRKGDVGTAVHIYENGKAAEVEFVTAEGKTIAVLTLSADEVKLPGSNEILHVREIAHS